MFIDSSVEDVDVERSGKTLNSTFSSKKYMFRRKQSERKREQEKHELPICEILELSTALTARHFDGVSKV